MEAGYISKAPMCAGRLEALTHFRRRRISLRLRLRSLWKVCSSLLAATATAEFGMNAIGEHAHSPAVVRNVVFDTEALSVCQVRRFSSSETCMMQAKHRRTKNWI
jgi:hypothetical protein